VKTVWTYLLSSDLSILWTNATNQQEITEMATYSSHQEKRQATVDPIIVLLAVALLCALVAFGPLNGRLLGSSHGALLQSGSASEVSLNAGTSFASNLQYWDTTCSHGWKSDSTCDALAAAAQFCVVGIGTDSAYCSQYDTYLNQFRGNK